jgi:hypothetical protein
MSSPAKRSQYGYQLGYIFGHDKSPLPKQRGWAGKAFLLGWRPGITGGFIGIGHGLRQIGGT